jgi:hypothetical protein
MSYYQSYTLAHFTPEEIADQIKNVEIAHEARRASMRGGDNKMYDAMQMHYDYTVQFYKSKAVRKIRADVDGLLGVLLKIVANRKGDIDDRQLVSLTQDNSAFNTPEHRRDLYTFLKGYSETPASYAMSATTRFFRGIGKQKGMKNFGCGAFGTKSKWKNDEVKNVVDMLIPAHYDSMPNVTLPDLFAVCNNTEDAIYRRIEELDAKGDYDHDLWGATFKATNIKRDKDYLLELCANLKDKGLAPAVVHAPKPVKKARKKKVFKNGDKITKSNIRDLPFGSEIELTEVLYRGQAFQNVKVTWRALWKGLADPSKRNSGVHCMPINAGTAYHDDNFSFTFGKQKVDFFRKSYHDETQHTVMTYVGEFTGVVNEKVAYNPQWYLKNNTTK